MNQVPHLPTLVLCGCTLIFFGLQEHSKDSFFAGITFLLMPIPVLLSRWLYRLIAKRFWPDSSD
jgi:hypothetical protein